MNLYTYWHTLTAQVPYGSQIITLTAHGGSNQSEAAARQQAQAKLDKLKRKLAGEAQVFAGYEADIREEVVRWLDERTAITRNRYGAQVLNAANLLMMDIDQAPAGLLDWLRPPTAAVRKQRMADQVRRLAHNPAYRALTFRIYETYAGLRVLVLGQSFDPRAPATQAMLKAFNCDPLYMRLCEKQNCFRARLTPKPGRMRLRGFRVLWPRPSHLSGAFNAWLAEYEALSRGYATCRFVEQVGHAPAEEAVRVHDTLSGIQHPHLPLA